MTVLLRGMRNLLAPLGAAVLVACGAAEPNTGQSTDAPESARVERRTLEVRAEAAGLVEPIRTVEVKSKASGEILRLHVETGDRVERGALLADIDPRDVRNALAQAEADLEVARARLGTAEAQRKRSKELRASNIITEEEFEAASLEEANARAQLVKARTNLELARERMGDVTIRAPIAGTVIQKSVEVGQIIASASQNISGGTTLLLMADLAEMQVRTLVDETDIGRIRAGLPGRVTVEAFPGRTFDGRVLKIEPQAVVEQNVTMFPVIVRLDNREGLLKPGMNAEVEIEVAQRENVLVVPNAAVVALRDAAAAAAVLGLDEARVMESLRGGGNGNGEARAPGEPAGASASPRGRDGAPAAGRAETRQTPSSGDAGAAGAPECRALREKVRGAGREGLSDAERTKLRQCMRASGFGSGAGGGGAGRGESSAAEVRPAIIFVQGRDGPEPRRVLLGLNDWEFSEVLSGVQEGEPVVLMSIARLQQQQQEMIDRFRQRAGGPIPGAGGGSSRSRTSGTGTARTGG